VAKAHMRRDFFEEEPWSGGHFTSRDARQMRRAGGEPGGGRVASKGREASWFNVRDEGGGGMTVSRGNRGEKGVYSILRLLGLREGKFARGVSSRKGPPLFKGAVKGRTLSRIGDSKKKKGVSPLGLMRGVFLIREICSLDERRGNGKFNN